ncbi:GNAT family N-acetyltransferase [Flavobacterium sinopsychrotolerans]|uniref:Acetyltransferase (GNAT) domain-containing protein n=1 Tax=Flavobacterium sinopsychrotolerans TaxID=604089 RepID=A0A1H8R924_9FLAO|nr:GNAT family N-acetyltransferase [Flavobacterium sinopsychrotolerans]SEO62797.1 Acetyltransferase (GNAT) domain-containing protein [Flavobacterium sinopsychrotolerans]
MIDKFKIRYASVEDSKILFDWANDADVRENAFNTEKIKWENHQEWFRSKMECSKTIVFILEMDSIPVGQVRFDYDTVNKYWLLDYSIDKKQRGLGLGSLLINYSIKKVKGDIRAFVKTENISSCKVFEKNNFFIKTNIEGIIEYRFESK